MVIASMSLPNLICQALQDAAGLDQGTAQEVAAQVIQWGTDNGYSGTEHYWPCKFRALPAIDRDAAIKREFNGRNLKEVCKKFDVSHTTVYQAVRRVTA